MHRLLPLILLLFACAPRHEVTRLEGPWEYSRDGEEWHAELEPDGARDFWLRAPIPERFTHAVFRAYVGEFHVSLDSTPVYHFWDPDSEGRLTLHVIPVAHGRQVVMRIPRAREGVVIGGAPYLTHLPVLPLTLREAAIDGLREDATDIVLGILLAVIGAIAFIASLIRRRGDARALRYFGLFTLLYGIRLVIGSYLPMLLGGSVRTFAFAEAFITYAIPVAGWALPMRLMGNGWQSSLRWQVIAFAIFAPIGIASDLITRTPGSLEQANNVLVIIGAVNIVGNLLRAVHRRTHELRVVLAGSLVFMLFALVNNLSALRVLPWREIDESFGFVVFVAALGYAAMRAFTRGERERVAIDNELTTAREIQRSILPTSMPQVAGLHVHTGYEPASSVAGDLYDFLAIDDRRVGVLVADVAGHGVPAALIASMVKIAFSSQARLADDPATLLAELNTTLKREVRRAFVTATYLWFDMTSRSVTVCNAGHAPPLLLRDGRFVELGDAGVLLGRFGSAQYTASTTALQPGDRILAFTDGITEARNAREEQFGEERLRALAMRTPAEIIGEVQKWRSATDPAEADDLTVVVVEVS